MKNQDEHITTRPMTFKLDLNVEKKVGNVSHHMQGAKLRTLEGLRITKVHDNLNVKYSPLMSNINFH